MSANTIKPEHKSHYDSKPATQDAYRFDGFYTPIVIGKMQNLANDLGKIRREKMGGMGSGRRDQSGKSTTSDYRALDVRRLHREGLLAAGKSFDWSWTRYGEKVASINVRTEADRVILDYRHQRGGGEWKSENYPVRVEWTPCHYGGSRTWFRCPTLGCGRRVAILYGGTIFACRHCYRLAYSSQRENLDDRATRRADKIRDRLKWELGILNGHSIKPKGMHSRTYQRLTIQHDTHVGISLNIMQQRQRMIEARLGGIDEDMNLFGKIELMYGLQSLPFSKLLIKSCCKKWESMYGRGYLLWTLSRL